MTDRERFDAWLLSRQEGRTFSDMEREIAWQVWQHFTSGGVERRHAQPEICPDSEPVEGTCASASGFVRASVREAAIQPCAGVTSGPLTTQVGDEVELLKQLDSASGYPPFVNHCAAGIIRTQRAEITRLAAERDTFYEEGIRKAARINMLTDNAPCCQQWETCENRCWPLIGELRKRLAEAR